MNNTNRVLNRAFVLVVGLLAVTVGGVAVALVTVPEFLAAWSQTAPRVTAGLSRLLANTPLSGTDSSWVSLAGLAGAALLVVALGAMILRQGKGHTRRLIDAAPRTDSATIVDAAVAEDLLTDALRGLPEFVAVSVSTYRVRRAPVLKVSATVRRGVAPRAAITVIDDAVLGLDRQLGTEIPVLVQLSGGLRTRLSGRTALTAHPTVRKNHPLEKERTQ